MSFYESARSPFTLQRRLWLATHALAIDATLVTNNTRDFPRVAGLRLENWAD